MDHLESLGRNARLRLVSSNRQAEAVDCFVQFVADCWVYFLKTARQAGSDVRECLVLVVLKQPVFREVNSHCFQGCLAKVFS